MIDLQTDTDANNAVSIRLQADRALGWAENVRHIRLHLLFTLCLGAGFVYLGFWPIAVFLLLASGLLGVSTWYAQHRLATRECITLTRDRIHLQRGRRQPQLDCWCERGRARLRVLRGPTPWHEPTVLLECAGHHWELGHDLGASDRRRLIRLLVASGLAEAANDTRPARAA